MDFKAKILWKIQRRWTILSWGSENLQLTKNAIKHLRVTAKWVKFLAILGFIFKGLAVLSILVMGGTLGMVGAGLGNSPLGALPGFLMVIIYLALAAVYFFPALFLFKFSQKTLRSIASESSLTLEKALENLRRLYVFMGVMAIIVLSLYIILIFVAIIVGLAQM